MFPGQRIFCLVITTLLYKMILSYLTVLNMKLKKTNVVDISYIMYCIDTETLLIIYFQLDPQEWELFIGNVTRSPPVISNCFKLIETKFEYIHPVWNEYVFGGIQYREANSQAKASY